MGRYERGSTLLTSNRPVEDWGKLLGDSAAVTAMLDRLLHHGHILKCGPRSRRTKRPGEGAPSRKQAGRARPELSEASTKCSHGSTNEIFSGFDEETALHLEILEIRLVRKANRRVQHLSPGPYGRF